MSAGVSRLGYLGYAVRDMGAVETIFGDVLGLQRRPSSTGDVDGAVSWRMDARRQRFTFTPAAQDALAYIGWELDSLDALHALVARAEAQGVAFSRADDALCEQRAVYEMYRCAGPDGVAIELFFGGIEDPMPFASATALSGFRTGSEGLGHLVLASADPEAAVHFYRQVLGFEPSDYVHWDIARVTFLHCNSRHHSLAVMNPVYGSAPGQMNHVMVQANAMDDVGRAYDRVRELGVPLVLTLGKHSNDQMTSFYMHTPGGWAVEYGYGGREIDADWQVVFYDSPRLWGHHLQQPAAPLR
ncbi:VOC family protein [Paraburkholderia sp. J63]|uniref:VOC family protein n=1 Tax=Paraburkholderia sp. J63 TaxID=2805434 RepID=UPI002ABE8E66|nr:VOC family protein [Paraburkholderia sp. J63]